jgi:uncharacterized phiE125 gp8 family phage protein
LNTPPATEPLTTAEAKAHLKVDTADDDALITRLIAAARARAEWHTGRALITQGWTLRLDTFPCDGIIQIPFPPLVSVTSLTTYARDDSATVMNVTHYTVDTANGRLALKPDRPPPTNLRRIDAIALAFTAGYGDASAVPPLLKAAILAIVAYLYEHRGEAPADLPPDTLALLAPYRILKV